MENPRLEFIREQNRLTRENTLNLLEDIPFDLWYETPEVIEANIAWLTGHLIVSQYFHSIAVITGPNISPAPISAWDIILTVRMRLMQRKDIMQNLMAASIVFPSVIPDK